MARKFDLLASTQLAEWRMGSDMHWLRAIISYLCAKLQTLAFMVRVRMFVNRVFSEHILYAWFTYHLPGLHRLGDSNVSKPFYAAVASGKSLPFNLIRARKHFCNFRNFVFCRNPPVNATNWIPRKGELLCESNIDLVDVGHGRTLPLTLLESEWLY